MCAWAHSFIRLLKRVPHAKIEGMKRYFITGMSGFLGRNLVLQILEQKETQVIGLVLPGDPAFDFYKDEPRVKLVAGNICNKGDVASFLFSLEDGDYVIHAAGRISVYGHNDPKTMEINVEGTKTVVDEALRHPPHRFVYVSSVDALDQSEKGAIVPPQRFDPDKAMGVYGKSKAIASNYVLDEYEKKGYDAMVVCPSALIGPNDPFSSPINEAVIKFCKGKIPALTPGGYDIVDVRDVARGILSALEKGRSGETYLLTGSRITVKELLGAFVTRARRKPPRFVVPFFLLYVVSFFTVLLARIKKKRPTLSPLAVSCLRKNPPYDTKKSEEGLGYVSRPFEQSADDFYLYIQEQGYLS